jgi:ribonuclease VapC
MSEVVFDASVMLAMILDERGTEKVTDELLDRSIASTVNLAEVHSKLVKRGYTPREAWEDTLSAVRLVEPYTSEHARIAGDLIAATEQYGLSLGDRSCLALAITLRLPVYTTERVWRNLQLGVPIHVIR